MSSGGVTVAEVHDFGYARADDGAFIAYKTLGEGPIDLVWQFDWLGNLDVIWEERDFARMFDEMASFSRVILHDRRATGLSSRDVDVPDLETRVADLVCVLDTIGAERPVLAGEREGGAPNILLAASDPGRVRSLIWYAPSACSIWSPDYPWGATPEYVERDRLGFETWGTAQYGETFIETEALDGHDIRADAAANIAKISRNTATPDVARRLTEVWYGTDIRPLLPAVTVPTLLISYDQGPDAAGELASIASAMPHARTQLLPGAESDGEFGAFFNAVREFIGIDRPPSFDSVLATVLFTDIVDSTRLQASLGDRGWKDLIGRHDALVRSLLERFRGREVKTMGDGFLATFDGPARGVRCAETIATNVQSLGIEIRAGVHTGEVRMENGDVIGLGVSIGARVMSKASASEVLVSQTVKDLVAGSGLEFEERGEHELKGVPGTWRLYRVVD